TDAPTLAFQSDANVQYVAIDPWSGMLPDSSFCESMMVPFLPGTAPQIYCQGNLFGEEPYDSLDSPDSVRFEDQEPETSSTPPEPENPQFYPDSGATGDDSVPRLYPRSTARSRIRR